MALMFVNRSRSQRTREADKTVHKSSASRAQSQVAKGVVWLWRGTWKMSITGLKRVPWDPLSCHFMWSWPGTGSLSLKAFSMVIGITGYFSMGWRKALRTSLFSIPFSLSTSRDSKNEEFPSPLGTE